VNIIQLYVNFHLHNLFIEERMTVYAWLHVSMPYTSALGLDDSVLLQLFKCCPRVCVIKG
jgi:hypothetical protein